MDRLDHVHGDPDRAGLIRDRAGDRLPDPPGGIGRELVTAAPLEFVDRFHQADIALLDQVQELQAAVVVLLGNRDDEPEIGLDQLALCLLGARGGRVDLDQDRVELGSAQPGLLLDPIPKHRHVRELLDGGGDRLAISAEAFEGLLAAPASLLRLLGHDLELARDEIEVLSDLIRALVEQLVALVHLA